MGTGITCAFARNVIVESAHHVGGDSGVERTVRAFNQVEVPNDGSLTIPITIHDLNYYSSTYQSMHTISAVQLVQNDGKQYLQLPLRVNKRTVK